MTLAHTLSVLLDEELMTLTRAVGILRRRNLTIRSIAVGPSGTPGVSRLTIMLQADEATADRVARQLHKVVGVHEAIMYPARDGVARELALVKVRTDHTRYGELLDAALLYKATVVDESSEAVILEVSGSEAFVLSFLRALERFEVLEVARTGAVALDRAPVAGVPFSLTSETVQ